MSNSILAFEITPEITSAFTTGVIVALAVFVFFLLLFGGLSKLVNAAGCSKNSNLNSTQNQSGSFATATPSGNMSADDDEIIAVISAAVYTMYDGTGKRPVIRSIRPSAQCGKSAWAMAGVYNNIKSF